MKTLIKNATVVYGSEMEIKQANILVEDETIIKVADHIEIEEDMTVIDATDLLVAPGLCNAHLHSDENLFKGMTDNLPLELWMLYTYPPLKYGPFSKRLIYLRTMLGAMEMIKHGVTLAQDDVSEYPTATLEGTDAVMEAYTDLGMRASVTTNLCDKQWKDKLPYLSDILPNEIKKCYPPAADRQQMYDLVNAMVSKWHKKAGMTNVVLAPVAPQRVTDQFFMDMHALAEKYDLPVHTHVLETKMQRVTGQEFYNTTLVQHMKDIGVLTDRTTIVHCVWVDDHDIQLLFDAKVTVAHNPASNTKLGSGILPYAKLRDAGVTLALGTDGMSSNDNQSIFEAMKLCALLHKVTMPDYTKWPKSKDVFTAATLGGARSTRRLDHTGSIEEGKKADLVFYDMNTTAFTPRNDILNHLVYCENGESIVRVMVNGKTVVQDGKILTVDEKALLAELRSMLDEYYTKYEITKEWSDKMFPYVQQVYEKSCQQSTNLNRLSGNESEWVKVPGFQKK